MRKIFSPAFSRTAFGFGGYDVSSEILKMSLYMGGKNVEPFTTNRGGRQNGRTDVFAHNLFFFFFINDHANVPGSAYILREYMI